jgi:hypothetical protein
LKDADVALDATGVGVSVDLVDLYCLGFHARSPFEIFCLTTLLTVGRVVRAVTTMLACGARTGQVTPHGVYLGALYASASTRLFWAPVVRDLCRARRLPPESRPFPTTRSPREHSKHHRFSSA